MSFDDDLKKRMALAKQQGWSDEEINRSALIERGLNRQQQMQQPQQKKGGRGGFATSLISEGGAAGGALAGAAAGSVVPGIGTVIGGALGGLAGGLFGSAAEQKVRDDKVDWRKAGIEGAFSAIPGGAGKAARAGVTAARQGVEKVGQQAARRGLTDEVKDLFTPQPGALTGRLQNVGADIRSTATGVRTGGRMEGRVQRLQPNEVQNTRSFLQQVGAKGTAERQLKTVQDVERNAANNINTIVTRDARPVTTEDIYGAQGRIRDRIMGRNGEGVGGFDVQAHGPIADRYAAQMANIKDSQGWLNFKRSLDDDINYARTNQSVDPKVEQIAKMFRREASDQLDRLHPDVAPYNKLYGQAQDAKNILVLNADPKGATVLGNSVNGRGVGGKTFQRTADTTGRNVQRAASFASTPAVSQFGAQLGISGMQNLFDTKPEQQPGAMPGDLQQAFGNPQSEDELILNELLGSGVNNFDELAGMLTGGQGNGALEGEVINPGGQQQTGSQYSSTELFNAAMKALQAGDQASAKQLSGMADQAMDIEKQQAEMSGGGGPNVTKVTAQQYGLAQSGAQALQQLSSLIQKDPGAVTRSATPGRSLPIAGGFISNAAGTGDFDAIGYNIADTILRLRTGATANESEVRKLQSQIMPRAGDSQQTIQTKMNQINSIFGNVLDLAGQGGGSSSSNALPEDMMQLLAGAY